MKARGLFIMDFQPVDNCPLCGSDSKGILGELTIDRYKFGHHIIQYKDNVGSIKVCNCLACGLFFKNWVPTRESLIKLLNANFSEVWDNSYNFINELNLVKKLFPNRHPDILDIGAGNGAWLHCLYNQESTLSALDLTENRRCKKAVTGEYILDFLDKGNLKWSGNSYDLITLFDVVEHLYNVKQGFANLQDLTKIGGYCLIETGDADSIFPTLYGITNWWYLNLLEHNVAFNLKSLTTACLSAGFEIVKATKKRNKNRSELSLNEFIRLLIKDKIYRINPFIYKLIKLVIKKSNTQPFPLLECDHLFLILRRVS